VTRNESEQEGTLRLLLSVPSSTIPNEGPLTIALGYAGVETGDPLNQAALAIDRATEAD